MKNQWHAGLFVSVFVFSTLFFCAAPPIQAHFGMLIPDHNIITQDKRQTVLHLSFSHPFAAVGMDMDRPARYFVDLDGQQTDLLPSLKPETIMGHQGWHNLFTFQRPGVYSFVMEPQPYWEPAEERFIIHYTKTIVSAFGSDDNWDHPLDLETEIVPLLRPFGNYAGNTFNGQVLVNGQPVANGEVEVELFNENASYIAPSTHHETQVVKTDGQGIFSFTCPVAGWWGFAALTTAPYTKKSPDNRQREVELGAVLWIYLAPWRQQQ